ncbi:hypothetical protein B0H10DRAFT_2219977 [Mycena sp. CBHHK59/15]|nr:hypothetical protein B0H10DRAFT_2219977 [Mycena sp. CBHHK59/15]
MCSLRFWCGEIHGCTTPEKMRLTYVLQFAKEHGVPEQHIRLKPPGIGPPVSGLRIVDNGFICRPCSFACPQESSFLKHRQTHKKRKRSDCEEYVGDSVHRGPIQTFSYPVAQAWFEVEPSLVGYRVDNLFPLYLDQHAPAYDAPPKLLPPPADFREVPPWDRLTQWPPHFLRWIGTSEAVASLWARLSLPAASPDGNSRIPRLVLEYISQVRTINNGATLRTRSLLMKCPLVDAHGEAWKAHGNDTTLARYGNLLQRLVAAVLHQPTDDADTTSYRFPLTLFEEQRVAAYRASLDAPTKNPAVEMREFHDFVALFLLKRHPSSDQPDRVPSKFDQVLECLCAISLLKEDGLWTAPEHSTQTLAQLKCLIRCAVLFQGATTVRAFGGSLERSVFLSFLFFCSPPFLSPSSVEVVAMENIRVGAASPFSLVDEYQRAASTLAFLTVHAPNMLVSDDGYMFTHRTLVLHVPQLHHGLRAMLQEALDLLADLRCGAPIPFDMPVRIEDDWPDETRDYTFLDNHRWHPQNRPLMQRLLGPASWLAQLDSEGRLRWSHHALDRYLGLDAHFVRLLMVLVYVSCSKARGTEFSELRIRNGHRPHALRFHDRDCWIVTSWLKTEVLTNREAFIPTLVPPMIVDVLLEYLVIVRPAVSKLAGIHLGPDAYLLHREFMWVVTGQRIPSNVFSIELAAATSRTCGVQLTLNPFCHFHTELSRTFIGGSQAQLVRDHGGSHRVVAHLASHSLQTERSTYAPEAGHLPTLSRDLLRQFKHACQDYHLLLNLFPPHPPLQPLLLLRPWVPPGAPPMPDCAPADALHLDLSLVVSRLSAVVAGELQDHRLSMKAQIHEAVASAFAAATMGHHIGVGLPAPQVLAVCTPPAPDVIELPPMAEEALVVVAPPVIDVPLKSLRMFLGNPNADFRDSHQRAFMEECFSRERNVLVLVRTGGGKSFSYLLPAVYQREVCSLVMCPNRAFLNDQTSRASATGITAFRWTVGSMHVLDDASLVFITLESIVSETFHTFLLVQDAGRYARLVIDKAQKALTDVRYRPHFVRLILVAGLALQKVLLCAGLFPRLEKPLLAAYGLPPPTTIVRGRLAQPHLRLNIVRYAALAPDWELTLLGAVFDLLRTCHMQEQDQGIIFCNSRVDAEAVGAFTHCLSHSTSTDRDAHQAHWMAGDAVFIASTSGLGQGINNLRCVVMVVFKRVPGLLQLLQELGHGGRREQETIILFFLPSTHYFHLPVPLDHEGVAETHAFFAAHGVGCLRVPFSQALDGTSDGCADIPALSPLLSTRGAAAPPVSAAVVPVVSAQPVPPATAPSISNAVAPLTPAPASLGPCLGTAPSMSISIDTAHYNQSAALRRQKEVQIPLLSLHLSGNCAVCWAWLNIRVPRHRPFQDCVNGVNTRVPAPLNVFFQFKHVRFPSSQGFCYSCGLTIRHGHPEVNGDGTPGCHGLLDDLVVHVAWTVRNEPSLWAAAQARFPTLSQSMTVAQYRQWVGDPFEALDAIPPTPLRSLMAVTADLPRLA